MRLTMKPFASICAAFAGILFVAASASAAGAPSLHPLPTETKGYAMAPGPDGAMWFVGHHGPEYEGGAGEYIGRVTGDWEVSEFSLPAGLVAGGPMSGPEGDLWFSSEPEGRPDGFGITRMTTTGQMTEYRLGGAAAEFGGMAAAGNELLIWVAEYDQGKLQRHELDRFAASPTGLTLLQQIVFRKMCFVTALAAAGEAFWYSESCERHPTSYSSSRARIVRLEGGAVTVVHRLPFKAFVDSLAVDPQGGVWFGSFVGNRNQLGFGRIAPTGGVRRWSVPTADTETITVGPEGRLWFPILDKRKATGRLQSIGPTGDLGKPICLGQKCGYSATSLAAGPDGEIWYSAEHTHLAYGGGGGGGAMEMYEISKESGFLGRVTP
jgi:streptogramin lyase